MIARTKAKVFNLTFSNNSIMKRKAEDDGDGDGDFDSEEREVHPVVRRKPVLYSSYTTGVCRDYEVRALLKAYEQCCMHELKDLFASGADINQTNIRLTSINCTDGIDYDFKYIDGLIGDGVRMERDPAINLLRTPLINAAYEGQAELTIYLLANGANVNAQDLFGCTALMYACFQECVREAEYIEVVESLLDNGADLSLMDSFGKTALICTCLSGGEDDDLSPICMQLLLEHDADVNAVDNAGWSALMQLCGSSKNDSVMECVRILLAHGADVNLQDNKGNTVLMDVILDSSEYDEDYDNVDEEGLSTSLLKVFLVEGGADVNIKNNYGESALYLSVLFNPQRYNAQDDAIPFDQGVVISLDAKLMEVLLEHGAHVDEPLKDGKTALYWICEKERDEVAAGRGEAAHQSIELLLHTYHANIEVSDNNGNTLLHCPTLTERTKLLLEEVAKGVPLK